MKIILKKLPEIKIKSFYIKQKCKNPFKIRFPNLRYVEYFHYSEVFNKILEDLEDLGNRELEYKFNDLTDKINDIINIKNYK